MIKRAGLVRRFLVSIALSVSSSLIWAAETTPVDCDFAISTDKALVRVSWSVTLGQQSLAKVWDASFAALHRYYDRDGDESLSAAEAARLPSVYAMREVLGSGFTPSLGQPSEMASLDTDNSGGISAAELTSYYRGQGIGAPTVGVGTMSHREAFQAALVKLFDVDADGQIKADELDVAASLIKKFDRNDDGLIGAGELVPGVLYPGAAGSQLLLAPKADAKLSFPVLRLPSTKEDNSAWLTVLLKQRDRDGDGGLSSAEFGGQATVFNQLDTNTDEKLSAEEFAAWRSIPTDCAVRVVMSEDDETPPTFALDTAKPIGSVAKRWPGLELTIRADRGHLAEAITAARKSLTERFTEDDADHNDKLDATEREKSNASPWHAIHPIADRDEDGQLTLAELNAWLDLQQQLARGQILFTILDARAGLFELLDGNHDGALSAAELRDARRGLTTVGAIPDGRFEMEHLPHVLLVTVSRGYPRSPLGLTERTGPAWFLALDRNLDGEVSRNEFAGSEEAFRKLDQDQNETISATEAAEVK